jgi:TolA-binding protein
VKTALILTLVATQVACWVPLTEGRAMHQDLVLLRDRMVALEDRAEAGAAALREKVAQATSDAAKIKVTMDRVDGIARRADANFGEQLRGLRQQLDQVVGRLEVIERGAHVGADENKKTAALVLETGALADRVAAVEAALKAAPSKPAQTVTPAKESVAKAAPNPPKKVAVPAAASSRLLYQGARKRFAEGKNAEGRELMQAWIDRYSRQKGKASAHDDALVAIAESWLKDKKPKRALKPLQKVYKMGAARADNWTRATYRMGECFEGMRDRAGAKAFYGVAAKKGKGAWAKKAEQRLKRLR